MKLLLGALQLPVPILPADGRHRIELHIRRLEEKIAEQQSTQMRELADSGIHLEGAEESHGANDHHEILHLDRNQEAPQNLAIREHHGVNQQNAKNSAGASDGGDVRVAPRQNVIRDDDADARARGAEEIEPHKAARSPDLFQLGAKHPERQHVPDDVTEAAVQKGIRDQLPDREVFYDVDWIERQVSERPVQPGQPGKVANDEDGDVADQQPLDALRKAREYRMRRWIAFCCGRT